MACTALAQPAFAQSGAIHPLNFSRESAWEATSSTALSVTGNIRVTDKTLTFQNGKHIGFMFLKTNGSNTARLYRVNTQGNSILKNNNRLCGKGKAPTYIAFIRSDFEDAMIMVPYDEPDEPSLRAPGTRGLKDGACATYHYSPPRQ